MTTPTLDAGEDRLIVDAFDRACAAYPRACFFIKLKAYAAGGAKASHVCSSPSTTKLTPSQSCSMARHVATLATVRK